MVDKTRSRSPTKWYERFTYGVVKTTESLFYTLGKKIATHPLRTIGICWLFVIISAFGLFRFYQEKNPMGLWVPHNSQFKKDSDWLMNTLETAYRTETILVVADDVLTPEVILQLYEIDQRVKNSISSAGVSYEELCFRIPEMDPSFMPLMAPRIRKTKKYHNTTTETAVADNNDDFDPSIHFDPHTYCKLVETMDSVCYTKSLLDLWQNKERRIRATTKEDILNRINLMKQDPIMGNLKNYEALLGGIITNKTGHIIGAKSVSMSWMTHLNFTAVNMDEVGNYAGTTEWATSECLVWENEFLRIMENVANEAKSYNMSVFYGSGRSFGDVSSESMFQGIDKLFYGSIIMLIYVQLVISKFNCVEARAVLGGIGLLSVGMALIASCGLCSLFGIPYGPIHTSLPFLLMGLGVDDMFVIVASWDQLQLSAEHRRLPLVERIGNMLKHAGVSITVTTATDVLAFIVGSTTVLPSLQSYCLYTAMGVFLTYVFVVTFFIACFTIDQKRLESNYNGILPWIKHENYKPNKFSQAGTSARVFRAVYSKVILTWPGKLLVVLITIVCLGFSVESIFKLEQKFDPKWFIPDHTYLGQFLNQKTIYYPTYGHEAGTYIGAVNYTHEYRNLMHMTMRLENSTDIISNIVSWVEPFNDFVLKYHKVDLLEEEVPDELFNTYLSKFLFSAKGARFQANFKFARPLLCGQPAPKIMMSSIEYLFKQFDGPHEHVPAMRRVMNISKEIGLTTGDRFSTAWSKVFATWITDEIIDAEVIRNIELALIAVMVCTSLLIANVQICFWVFVMIILSMVNVCGFMQKWGLTIDIVSCVGLQLAIGLCVDYATHIGHKFLTIAEGDRNERVINTVTSIGAAVLFGGCSTLIGVTMLGFSDSYNFRAFFKIFLLVIIFGLFHGVVLLPVILSWVGPKPYKTHKVLPIPQRSDVINTQINDY